MVNPPNPAAERINVQLNSLFYEAPEETASKTNCKAIMMKTAAIVTAVAMVAIIGVIMAFCLGLGALSGGLLFPLLLVGLTLSTIPLKLISDRLWERAHELSQKAEVETGVRDELRKMLEDGWKDPQKVRDFFTEHDLPRNDLPFNALRQIEREEPLLAFLPLIARFNYYKEKADACKESAQKFAEANYNDRETAFKSRIEGKMLSQKAVINMLEAGVILKIISIPVLQQELSEVGKCEMINPLELYQIREHDKEDPFFFFPNHPPMILREPLMLTELEADLNADRFCQKLYPVRA